MRVTSLAAAAMLGFWFALPAPAPAFDWSKAFGGPGNAEAIHTFKLIHVAQLKQLIASPPPDLRIYDANAPETREKYGVIPGATLIAAPDGYRVSATLPPDKHAMLVFYCANQVCIASHEAARRAVAAGYTDVSVMGDGIMGWKAAGQPTVPAASTASHG